MQPASGATACWANAVGVRLSTEPRARTTGAQRNRRPDMSATVAHGSRGRRMASCCVWKQAGGRPVGGGALGGILEDVTAMPDSTSKPSSASEKLTQSPNEKPPVYLLDTMAFIFRAYHAMQRSRPMSTRTGIPTAATYVFV